MTRSEAIAAAASAIQGASSLAVSCHVNPDGDALGSALALAHAARGAGKEAVVAFGGPQNLPHTLSFLDTEPLVSPGAFPAEPACMVVFDVADASRLGELEENARRAGTLIVVDHHMSNEGFGDVAVIEPATAASAQLATYLIEALGWEIDQTVALCLLTGIVTDTGRFQYAATDGETMRVAARLLDAGARPEVIGQGVYEAAPFGYLGIVAKVLGSAVLDEGLGGEGLGDEGLGGEGLGLVWSKLTTQDLADAGLHIEQTDGLIDDLRVAREADVALLLKETADGWKGSLRSRGRVDVARIAAQFGGGGHHNAAGFHEASSVDEIVARVRVALGG